jgi:hypothetical protein
MASFAELLKGFHLDMIPTVLSLCGLGYYTAKYSSNDNKCHLMSTRNVLLRLIPQTGCQRTRFVFP